MLRPKVLVVDDDYAFAEFAKMLLESSGCEALIALDPVSGLKIAAAERPGLILMDLAMKEMNGIEAIRLLKAAPATRAIPVVLCSISPSASDVAQAKAAGAVDHLIKPLKREHIALMLSRHAAPEPEGKP